ncbi:MAG: hypothetical protein HWN67_07405 [Candidatus Helarchaeota archaeon]|nr:hypothetical protein [Candidatus Helarchaeota archaeon]
MENKTNFGLGLTIHVLSIVTAIIPTFNDFLFTIFYWIGILIFLASGILLLIGGIQDKRDLILLGSIFGLVSCGLLLVSTFYGIFWNGSRIGTQDFLRSYAAFFVLQYMDDTSKGIAPMIMALFFILPNRYKTGFYGSVIHNIMAFAGIALVLINFWLKESKFK